MAVSTPANFSFDTVYFVLSIEYCGNPAINSERGWPVSAMRLKIIGIATAARSPLFPEVKTVAEQGFPGFDAAPWWYVAAPAGTPADIVKKLSDELVKASKAPDVIKKVRDAGIAVGERRTFVVHRQRSRNALLFASSPRAR